MLKVGDMVKVIAEDNMISNSKSTIGYIGEITEYFNEENIGLDNGWHYGENQLEKGHLEWIKED